MRWQAGRSLLNRRRRSSRAGPDQSDVIVQTRTHGCPGTVRESHYAGGPHQDDPTKMTRISGLLLPNTPWPKLLARCRELEALGFHAAYVDDHLVNPADPDRPWLDVWTVLAAMAMATSRIRLGPLVANIVLRSPVFLARQALSVDHISAGRLTLGVGAGYAPTDHRFNGTPQWARAERQARFEEAVAILDRGLRGDEIRSGGPHYPVDGLILKPDAVQRPRPPLVVAAHEPRSIRLAARIADAWVFYGGWGMTSDEALRRARPRAARLEEACEAADRDPASVGRVILAGSPAVSDDAPWRPACRLP